MNNIGSRSFSFYASNGQILCNMRLHWPVPFSRDFRVLLRIIHPSWRQMPINAWRSFTTIKKFLHILMLLVAISACEGGGSDGDSFIADFVDVVIGSGPSSKGSNEVGEVRNPGNEIKAPNTVLQFTSDLQSVALHPDENKLYVSDALHRNVTVFDIQNRSVFKFIPLGFEPSSISFSTDGSLAFVIPRSSTGVREGVIIDAVGDKILGRIDLEFVPTALAVAPDSSEIYIAGGVSDGFVGTAQLAVIEPIFPPGIVSIAPVTSVPLSNLPLAVSLLPDGSKAYVAIRDNSNPAQADEIAVIDLQTRQQTASVDLGQNADPIGFAVTNDGSMVFVANRQAASIVAINTSNDSLDGNPIVFSPETTRFSADGPLVMVLSNDEQRLFVGRSFRVFPEGFFTGDVEQDLNIPERPTSDEAHCFNATASDGTVTDFDGRMVTVIDIANRSVVQDIEVGRAPVAIVLADNGDTYYVASNCDPVLTAINSEDLTNKEIAMVDRATSMVANEDGSEMYIAHPNAISILNSSTDGIVNYSPRGSGVSHFSYNPALGFLYAVRPGLDRVDVIDTNDAQNATLQRIPTQSRPSKSLIANSDVLMVLSSGAPGNPGTEISRIQASTTLLPVIGNVGVGPTAAVLSEDKTKAYITSYGDLIHVETSQPSLREGFGSQITVIEQLEGAPIISRLNNDVSSDLRILGPLDITLIPDIAITVVSEPPLPNKLELHDWIAFSNYGDGDTVFAIDVADLSAREFSVPQGPTIVQSATIQVDGKERQLLLVLSIGSTDLADRGTRGSLVVVDFVEVLQDRESIFSGCDLDRPPECIVEEVGISPVSITIGTNPSGVTKVLVTNFESDDVTIFDLASLLPDAANSAPRGVTLPVGDGPTSALIAGDGTAYVANQLDNSVSIIDLAVNLPVLTSESPLSTNNAPVALIADETGRIYVGNMLDNTITVIEGRAVIGTIQLEN